MTKASLALIFLHDSRARRRRKRRKKRKRRSRMISQRRKRRRRRSQDGEPSSAHGRVIVLVNDYLYIIFALFALFVYWGRQYKVICTLFVYWGQSYLYPIS